MQSCKGTCETKLKIYGASRFHSYRNGYKRCQTCDVLIKYEGLWCPCCNTRLRTMPRNSCGKAKLRGVVFDKGEPNIKVLVGFTKSGQPVLEEVV